MQWTSPFRNLSTFISGMLSVFSQSSILPLWHWPVLLFFLATSDRSHQEVICIMDDIFETLDPIFYCMVFLLLLLNIEKYSSDGGQPNFIRFLRTPQANFKIKKNWCVGNSFLEKMLYRSKSWSRHKYWMLVLLHALLVILPLQPCPLKLLQHEFLHHGRNRKNGPTNSSCLLLFLSQIVSQWKWRRHDPVIHVLQTI